MTLTIGRGLGLSIQMCQCVPMLRALMASWQSCRWLHVAVTMGRLRHPRICLR